MGAEQTDSVRSGETLCAFAAGAAEMQVLQGGEEGPHIVVRRIFLAERARGGVVFGSGRLVVWYVAV